MTGIGGKKNFDLIDFGHFELWLTNTCLRKIMPPRV
jgi:hypothetical protein